MFKTTLLCLGLAIPLLAQAEVKNINNQQLQELLQQGTPLIDVRRAEEWKHTGVVESSHLLTFFDEKGGYDMDKWLAELDKIVTQKDQPFILICRTGSRTRMISRALDEKLGYSQVSQVTPTSPSKSQ